MANGRTDREELESVLAALDRAAARYPPDAVWISRQRAEILLRLGRLEECVAACGDVLRRDRSGAEDWTLRAGALIELGRCEEALPDAAEAIRLDPGDDRPHAALATALAELGRPEEAEAAWDEAIRIDPRNPAWFAGRSRTRFQRRRELGALADAEAGRAIDPGDADLLGVYTEMLLVTGDSRAPAAAAELTAAVPGDARAWELAARIAEQRELWSDALAAADRALAIDPGRSGMLVLRIDMFLKLDRPGDVFAAAGDAIAGGRLDSPNIAAASVLRGRILCGLERYGEALDEFARALGLYPEHHHALAGRGEACYMLERYEEALAAERSAAALDPGNADLLGRIAETLRALDRPEEALAAADEALAAAPRDGKAWMLKAFALLDLWRPADAA